MNWRSVLKFLKLGNIYLMVIWIVLPISSCQKIFPSKVVYTAKKIFDMHLDLNPISVQLIMDPELGNNIIPSFDMVLMSYFPRSEIRRIRDLTTKLENPSAHLRTTKTVTDYTTLVMPNSVGSLPEKTIDDQPFYVWWVATGSFGPSSGFPNSVGGIYLIDMTQKAWVPTPIYYKKHYGFSHVEWMDMDLDQKVDCITVEGTLNRATLIWLGQPRANSGLWKPHPISNSTFDVGGTDFKIMQIRVAGRVRNRVMIVVAGRRTASLTAFWVDDIDNDWTQTSKIRSTTIASGEAYVSVAIVDLNGDGTDEILTSAAAFAGRPGRVLAFEAPRYGFGYRKWRRRILAEWEPSQRTYRTLTPGPAYPFFITTRDIQATRKPHILVSGADDGKVYVLAPDSWSPFIWEYTVTEIFSGPNSIGIPAVRDVEGDGNAEIFIPSGETITVMKYQPSKASITSTSPSFHKIFLFVILSTVLSYSLS